MKKALGYVFTEARKAAVAFAGGALSGGTTALLAALQATSDGGVAVTDAERGSIVAAALISGVIVGLAVFGVRNVPQGA